MVTGASTVKYTTSLPSIDLSENDSKAYNFEGKNHKHLKNTLIYKAKRFMLTNKISRKAYIF